MWKALIKLVEKWSYRCDHKFQVVDSIRRYETEYCKMPIKKTIVFMCERCGQIKRIES